MRLNHGPLVAVLLSSIVAGCNVGARHDDSGVAPQSSRARPSGTNRDPQQVQKPTPPDNADAQVLEDFKHRIDAYMKLYERQEKGAAQPKETSKPEKIKATQDTLAARIQAARKDAKAGDIFTPEIRQLFRRLMYPEMKGPDAAETKRAVKEDGAPPRAKVLKVNARYPEGAPLTTMPPNLLERLPQLPEELEYRILDKDLILRDVNANVIVDYIPNAIR